MSESKVLNEEDTKKRLLKGNFPEKYITLLHGSDRWMIAMEICKHVFAMVVLENKWPFVDGKPKFYLYPTNKCIPPNFANYDEEFDKFGPGIYTYVLKNGFETVYRLLKYGDRSENRLPNFIFVLELVNTESCFDGNVVMELSSIEDNEVNLDENKQVSTDGSLVIFHPNIIGESQLIEKSIKIIEKVIHSSVEIEKTEILNQLIKIKEKIYKIKALKKNLNSKLGEMHNIFTDFKIGLTWSNHADFIKQKKMLKLALAQINEEDSSATEKTEKVKRMIDLVIDLNEQIQSEEISINQYIKNTIRFIFLLIENSKKIAVYKFIQDIPKVLNYLTSFHLGINGYKNSLESDNQPEFLVRHVFSITKNTNTKISRMEFKDHSHIKTPWKVNSNVDPKLKGSYQMFKYNENEL